MLLLDTHIWIRWHNPQPNSLALPQNLITLIETSERVAISAISCWELGQLVKRKRIRLSLSLEEWVEVTLDSMFPNYIELKDRLLSN